MEPNANRYYQSSGAVPLMGTALMQLFGAVSALVLGFAYAAANYYSPSVWLTFFAVLFYGGGVGFAVKFGAQLGKVRNTGFVLLLGTATGILAVYFAWVFYIYFLSEMTVMLWSPLLIFENMQSFAEKGLWSFKSWTPTGFWLWAFWMAEAAMIVLLSLAISISNDTPFCDPCNCWTKKADDVARFPLTDPQQLKEDLEAERYEVLETLHQGRVKPNDCLKAIIHSCPQCEESDYLTISHVEVVVDKDGDETTNENEIVTNLWISRELTDHIQELGESTNDEPSASLPEDEVEF